MTALAPFEPLSPAAAGVAVPLPPEIAALYGALTFPPHAGRPWVISNFVTTLDGVVSLAVPGQNGGRAISGDNQHDRLLVATLCAVADTIVIGGGTLRTSHNHLWTPEFLAPDYADAFTALRRALGKAVAPLTVVVSGHGDLDPTERMFQAGEGPALIVTTRQGARRLRTAGLPAATPVVEAGDAPDINPRSLLDSIVAAGQPTDLVLLEAGPRLTAGFLAARLVDELFLTLSPQIAGREAANSRPGLAMGLVFAPNDPLWGELVDVRRGGSHLFMRYALPRAG